MKSIILILVIGVAATYGQYRPSYAPAGWGSSYPRPQSYYEEEQAMAESPNSNVPQVDANLIKQMQYWPKEKMPFWYLNSQHINKHINNAPTYGQHRPSYAPAGWGSTYPRPQSYYEEELAMAENPNSNVPQVDENLIKQMQYWPKDKLPFWYLNAQHINKHIGNVDTSSQDKPFIWV